MISISVVLGIAMLGTPEAVPGCDCANDAAGSRDHEFHWLIFSIQFDTPKEYDHTL